MSLRNLFNGGRDMVIELKVKENILCCPFCGGMPQRLYSVEIDKYWIQCNNGKCNIQPMTDAYKTKGLDAKAWNKRNVVLQEEVNYDA